MSDDESSNIFKVGHAGDQSYTNRTSPWDERGRTKIFQIFLSHGISINSIQFQYAENGRTLLSQRYGTSSGTKFDVVRFKHPDEYIKWIKGGVIVTGFTSKLRSLTFGTNLGEYGPYGSPNGCSKEYIFRLGEGNQFGGFYGSFDGSVIESIGVYLKPSNPTPIKKEKD